MFKRITALFGFLIGSLFLPFSSTVYGQDNMMNIESVNPESLYDPAPNGYSHAIVATNVEKIAYIAGQGGESSDGTLSPNFSTQVERAYRNLLIAIEAVGGKPEHVTKLTTYVVAHEQAKLPVMTKHLIDAFGNHLPAQSLVPVPRLALDGMLFEVDAVVILGK